ncbi:MAG: hypothetical protein R2857_05195 [Vampirovibrionales bacterium]
MLAEAVSTVNWHSPYVRLSCNTTCTFGQGSAINVVLQKTTWPFWIWGRSSKALRATWAKPSLLGITRFYADMARQSEAIFEAGVAYWKTERPTGLVLYRHVNHLIEVAGYQPNLDPAGHLIGSFPHKGVYTDGLNHYPHYPEPGLDPRN